MPPKFVPNIFLKMSLMFFCSANWIHDSSKGIIPVVLGRMKAISEHIVVRDVVLQRNVPLGLKKLQYCTLTLISSRL